MRPEPTRRRRNALSNGPLNLPGSPAVGQKRALRVRPGSFRSHGQPAGAGNSTCFAEPPAGRGSGRWTGRRSQPLAKLGRLRQICSCHRGLLLPKGSDLHESRSTPVLLTTDPGPATIPPPAQVAPDQRDGRPSRSVNDPDGNPSDRDKHRRNHDSSETNPCDRCPGSMSRSAHAGTHTLQWTRNSLTRPADLRLGGMVDPGSVGAATKLTIDR